MVLELLPPVILYIPNTVNQKHITQIVWNNSVWNLWTITVGKTFCARSVTYVQYIYEGLYQSETYITLWDCKIVNLYKIWCTL